MTIHELIETWFPVAREIAKTNGMQMTNNLVRALGGGRSK